MHLCDAVKAGWLCSSAFELPFEIFVSFFVFEQAFATFNNFLLNGNTFFIPSILDAFSNCCP